jgi:hypothetical protein
MKDRFSLPKIVMNIDVEEHNKIGQFVTSDKEK